MRYVITICLLFRLNFHLDSYTITLQNHWFHRILADWFQLIIMILSHLPVVTLAKLVAVSRHFQDAVEPTLKTQLRAMAQRNDIKLMLLCACPDSTQSRVRCQFLQTPGLDAADDKCAPRTTAMHSIYRPEKVPPHTAPIRPAIGSFILLLGGDDLVHAHMGDVGCRGFATRQVTLEDHENFIQLRVKLNVVIAAKELFIAPAFVVHDGMIRIGRAWLEQNTEEIIWMSREKSLGLRMRAIKREMSEDDEAKSFDLEIQGMFFCLLDIPRWIVNRI